MKLLSWNVNGIRACVRNGFADFLRSEEPDAIGVQEIKIDNEARAKEQFDFPVYEEYWNPAQKKGYAGTAIFSKIKPINVIEGINDEYFDKEGRVITLEFEKFYFVNMYFPNAQAGLARIRYKEDFNKAIIKFAKKLEKKKPVVMTGDFNVAPEEIDLTNPQANKKNPGFSDQERFWAKEFAKNGFIDTFRHLHPDKVEYSWWSYRFKARERNIGWRIDMFLVSESIIKKVKKAYILTEQMGSDHAPVGLEIDL